MKADPAAIDALLSRFPGAKVMGLGGFTFADPAEYAGGKLIHRGHRPRRSRRVGPNGEFKMELDFEAKVIVPKLYAGEIYSYKYEPKSFRLCDPAFGKATYKPDFMGVTEAGLCAWEVKGFMREAAFIRLKVFADKYRHIPLYLCRRGKGGVWNVERIGRSQ